MLTREPFGEFDLQVTIPIGQRIINVIVSGGLLDMSCATEPGHSIMGVWSERAAKEIGKEVLRAVQPSDEWIAKTVGGEHPCDGCDSDYASCCGAKSPNEPEADERCPYFVKDIIRIPDYNPGGGWRLYRITCFDDGGEGGESTYELEAIDNNEDTPFTVPCVMLDTHPGVEKVK